MEELTGVNASLGVEATETQTQLTKVVEMRVEAEIQAADIERGALAVRLCFFQFLDEIEGFVCLAVCSRHSRSHNVLR